MPLLKAFTIAALLPQEIASIENTLANAARPGRDYEARMMAIAASQGLAPNQVASQFFNSKGYPFTSAHGWMADLGITPEIATNSLMRFGIAGPTGDANKDIVAALAAANPRTGLRNLPGLGMLPDGAIDAVAGNAAKYGLINPTGGGISEFTRAMSDALLPAVRGGLNSSEILRSIDTGISLSARGNIVGAAPVQLANYITGFTAAAGGRSGELGLSVAVAEGAAVRAAGTDPMRTTGFATSPIGQAKNKEDVRRDLDRTDPGLYDNLMQNPATRQMLEDLGSADPNTRMNYLKELVGGTEGVPPALGAANEANNNNAVVSGLGAGPQRVLGASRYAGISIGAQYLRNADASITSATRRYGVSAAVVRGIIGAEGGIDKNGNPITNAVGAVGWMQLKPGTAGMSAEALKDVDTNINAGTKYLSKLRDRYGDYEMALEAYNWGEGVDKKKGIDHDARIRAGTAPSEVQAYARNVLWRAGLISKTDANDLSIKESEIRLKTQNKLQADAGNTALNSSLTTGLEAPGFTAIVAAAGSVTQSFQQAITALQTFNTALAGANSTGYKPIPGGGPNPYGK